MKPEDVSVLVTVYLVSQTIPAGRASALSHLLELALYLDGGSVAEVDLEASIQKVLPAEQAAEARRVIECLDRALEAGTIIRSAGRLQLSSEESRLIQEANDRAATDERHFADHLVGEVDRSIATKRPSLSDPMIVDAVTRVIVGAAQRSLQNADKILSEPSTQPTGAFDPVAELTGQLKIVAQIFDIDSLGRMLSAIRTFFGDLDPQCGRHVTSLYQRVFCHQLLNLDPTLHEIQLTALAATRLYIDTNVALDFMLSDSASRRPSAEVVSGALDLGVQLFLSSRTSEELRQVRDSAKKNVQLLEDERLRRIIRSQAGAGTNPFLAAFADRKARQPALTWTGFLAPFEDPEAWFLGKDILVDDGGVKDLEDHQHYQRVVNSLRTLRPMVHDAVIDHDAKNFLLIHELRARIAGNILFGPSVWLISRDRGLPTLESMMVREFPEPHSKQVVEWGELFLSFQSAGRYASTDYIGYLMQAKLGIVHEKQGVDLAFVSMLKQLEEFELGQILDLQPEHAAQVLIDLQFDREAQELLARGTEATEPEQRRAIAKSISERAIEVAMTAREKALKDAEDAQVSLVSKEAVVESLQAEKRQILVDLDQARGEVESLKTASFFTRLRRVFRPDTP